MTGKFYGRAPNKIIEQTITRNQLSLAHSVYLSRKQRTTQPSNLQIF